MHDQFWDGWGAHVDFTQSGGDRVVAGGLREQFLDYGIDAAWNDNNEYEIWDEDGHSNGFGAPLPMARSRPLHGLLMTRASAEAQAARTPGSRVYTVTRAGMPGMRRYAQTWSGDNTTSWHTLRWNQRMGLSMGLSGMFNIGHDIGGFAGPTPDAELLARWMQACALNPRCIMNSWKEDGSVNTPWLHPDATAHIRAAIELRLTLLPYLYSCLHESVAAHRPVLRPTFLEFPNDPQCWEDNDEFLVGAELLVAPVLDAGSVTRSLYLPQSGDTPGWRCFHSGAWYPAGQTIAVAAPIERLPLFVRSNAVLPATDTTDYSQRTDEPSRALRLYPAPANAPSRTSTPWVEDDGITLAWQAAALTRITATLAATADAIQLNLAGRGTMRCRAIECGSCCPRARRARSTSRRGHSSSTLEHDGRRRPGTVACAAGRSAGTRLAAPGNAARTSRSGRRDHRGLASRPERRGRCTHHRRDSAASAARCRFVLPCTRQQLCDRPQRVASRPSGARPASVR